MIGALIGKHAVMSGFKALNNRDIESFMKAMGNESVWIYPGDLAGISGTFTGKENVKKWFEKFFEQFPKIQFEVHEICVKNIFDLIGNNVMAAHWSLKLVNKHGENFENKGVTLLTAKAGKVIHGEDFLQKSGGDTFNKIWRA